jgi:hypothetical protein
MRDIWVIEEAYGPAANHKQTHLVILHLKRIENHPNGGKHH